MASSAERDYSHRDLLDKLGIKPGHVVVCDESEQTLDPALRERALDRCRRSESTGDTAADVVLVAAEAATDVVAVLRAWKERISPAGGIWLLTPKRHQPGYVDQRALIDAGLAAGLVDNKSCSVSDTTSAMRWVIRRADRKHS